jgi:hypothetical protein
MRTITIFATLRALTLGFLKLFPKTKLSRTKSDDINIDRDNLLLEIQEKGFSDTFKISPERVEKIIAYNNTVNYKGIDGQGSFNIDYNNPQRPSNQLWYTNPNAEECDAVKELVYNEDILHIAKQYLGKEPTIKDVRTWWSFPQDKKEYNHLYGFHYDIDAYKFLKMFVYITDVDENGGPHAIISKTHMSKDMFEKKNRRLTDEMAEEKYGKDRIFEMKGERGTCFFEDTFSYHKGTSPNYPRLILQLEFSI